MKDAYGYRLKVKMQAGGDELAAAAKLVIGQTTEKVPVAIIRWYNWTLDEEGSAKYLSLIKVGYECMFEGAPLIPEKPGLAEMETHLSELRLLNRIFHFPSRVA